eukprot:878553-Ditylum_brightwellii.AAC.1
MDNNNLDYVETGESKQCDCIKNLIIKGKHQYIRCFNTFLEKNTGFNFSISHTGSKDKLEYGDLKMDFLDYHNKEKSNDMGPLNAWNEFRELHNFNDFPDDNE